MLMASSIIHGLWLENPCPLKFLLVLLLCGWRSLQTLGQKLVTLPKNMTEKAEVFENRVPSVRGERLRNLRGTSLGWNCSSEGRLEPGRAAMVQARLASHTEGQDEASAARIHVADPGPPGPSWVNRRWPEEPFLSGTPLPSRMAVSEGRQRAEARMAPRRSAFHAGVILAALVLLLRAPGATAVSGTYITRTTPRNGPQTGGQSLTLSGQEFGLFVAGQKVRLGGTAVTATVWVSESSIIVPVPNGTSLNPPGMHCMPPVTLFRLTSEHSAAMLRAISSG